MRESFWSKVLENESFDAQRFKKYVNYIAKLTYVTSLNKRLHIKKGVEMSKKGRELAETNLVKYSRICLTMRRMIVQNPKQSIEFLAQFISSRKFDNKTRNSALLLEQIIFAKQFESFVFQLLSLFEKNQSSSLKFSWLRQIIQLIGTRRTSQLKENLKLMELSSSPQMKKLTKIPSVKCCQIAYRLAQMEQPRARKLLMNMKRRLVGVLGTQKTSLLVEMTKLLGNI